MKLAWQLNLEDAIHKHLPLIVPTAAQPTHLLCGRLHRFSHGLVASHVPLHARLQNGRRAEQALLCSTSVS